MTMRLAGVLIGPAILAFLIVTGLSYVVPEPSSESQTPATGLLWNGRVFASRGDFAVWLEERGRSYREWERLHPASPWATTKPTKAASASGTRTLTSNTEQGSESVVVATLGAALVLVIGLLAIGVVLLVRLKMTVDRLMEPSLLAPRTVLTPSENGARTVAESRPHLAGAGEAARRSVEAAKPRLESAGLAARRGVEAAKPRLESAGLAARHGVEAAAAETALVSWSARRSFAMRGAVFYAFAAAFSAGLGVATALLLLLALGEV
jgi:hypothetical protein